MSGGLTDDQVQLLHDTLSSVTNDRIFPEIVETALFATFTVLICVSTGIHLTKGLRNWMSRAMFMLTLFMYASSACAWACDLKIMWNELNIFLPGLLSPTTQVGEDIDGALIALDGRWIFSYCVLSQINILLSDAIVLWRACLVWNWHRGVICVTVLFLVSLLGLNIFYILTEVTTYFPTIAPGSRLPAASDFADVDVALFSLSACTNVWATSMVAYRAWIHRREISRYFQKQAPKSVVENVMVLLVESGVIYSIIMVIYVLSGSPFKPLLGTASVYYWSVVVTQVAGMYPTLIIILVALQKSHCEHQFSFMDKGPNATLPFFVRVQPRARTSSLQLASSQDIPTAHRSRGTSADELTPQEKTHFDT